MAPITGSSNNNVKLCMSYEFDSFEKEFSYRLWELTGQR